MAILILVIGALFVAPSLVLSSLLEGDLRGALRAREASVRVTASPLAAVQGRLSRLHVRARGADFGGTIVDEVVLDLYGLTVDPGRALRGDLVLRGLEGGTAELVVGEENLRRYLESRAVEGATVRMAGGVLEVTGRVAVLSALVDVTLHGGLVLRDGLRVDLEIRDLRVSGVLVPRELGTVLAVSVNPLLTAPQEPVPLRFTGVTVDGGTVHLTAEVRP